MSGPEESVSPLAPELKTSDEPSLSPALRHYGEVCVAAAPPEVRERWYDLALWVEEHIAQDVLLGLYRELLAEFIRLRDAEESSPEGRQLEWLYAALDVLYYALSEASIALVHVYEKERAACEA